MKHNFHLLLLLICFQVLLKKLKILNKLKNLKPSVLFYNLTLQFHSLLTSIVEKLMLMVLKILLGFYQTDCQENLDSEFNKTNGLELVFTPELIGKLTEKLVAVPMFGNLRISPGLGNGSRITLQAGLGKGFALGRGNLVGTYQKYSIGIETDEDFILFAEISGYDFKIHNISSVYSFSLGIALRTF